MKWSEASNIQALAMSFEWWRRTICPNVQEGSEMDFLMLTTSDILWECEIKISMSDWKADLKKVRHYNDGWAPARFYYAVPEALVENGIPEWVPAHAGVIMLYDRGDKISARMLRQSKSLHRRKAALCIREAMLRKIYFRYWTHVSPVIAAAAPKTLEVPDVS